MTDKGGEHDATSNLARLQDDLARKHVDLAFEAAVRVVRDRTDSGQGHERPHRFRVGLSQASRQHPPWRDVFKLTHTSTE